ncbi:MAG: hypothetical protein F4W68_03955 [Cenarchaeum sp. SB0661_bin_35]|nr:hypothetical protein [Cenarchaeum sp. SB0662_bin_33]MYC79637.1 hypothetical protein [Cenarchaeum sp. SB0661_bin_35]MYG33072.1 hypothetical protein [Cenarchaeum sp. SB0677_bin_16]
MPKREFNRNEAVLARWKSGDGMLASLLARDMRLIRAAVWMSLRVSWSDIAAKRSRQALEILAHEDIISRVTPH